MRKAEQLAINKEVDTYIKKLKNEFNIRVELGELRSCNAKVYETHNFT